MTVQEAAKLLEVSPYTVYKLCEQGLLSHHRIGTRRGTIRIEPADVAAYKASRRVEAHPAPEVEPQRRGPRSRGRRPEVHDFYAEYLAKKAQSRRSR